MQYVQSGFKTLLFGFRWAPHHTQIEKSNLLLGTFGAKLRCVLIFFYFTWRSFVLSKVNAKIVYVSKDFDSFLGKFSSFLKCGSPYLSQI
jgi:hypothetical protein